MSLPMMTFSLSPRRVSVLPSMAASVSTLVVSWKEAADRKLSVASEALVMPRMTCSASAGWPPSSLTRTFSPVEDRAVDELTGQELRVAGDDDAHLLHHLPGDELDVLVVDLDALRAVDLLHLVDEVALGGRVAGVLEHIGRVERAGRERRALVDPVAVLHENAGAARGDDVLLRRALLRE